MLSPDEPQELGAQEQVSGCLGGSSGKLQPRFQVTDTEKAIQLAQKTSSQAFCLYPGVPYGFHMILGSDIPELHGRQPGMAAQPQHGKLWKPDRLELLILRWRLPRGSQEWGELGEGNFLLHSPVLELVYEMAQVSRYFPPMA